MRLHLIQTGFIACGVGLVALAVAFGGTLAIGSVWLWGLAGAVDLVWALLVGARVSATYGGQAVGISAGERLRVTLTVSGANWLPAPAVTLRDGLDSPIALVGRGQTERRPLGVRGEFTVARHVQARRGRYRLGPLLLGVEGPLGIWSLQRRVQSEEEIVVLPRLQTLSSWPLEQPEAYGGAVARSSPYTDPTLIAGTRPLLPGDSLRRIHWKRTARTGTLYVREDEPSAGGRCLVVLDLFAGAYRRDNEGQLLDRAVELAAAVAEAVLRGGAALDLAATASDSVHLRELRGRGAVPAILEALAGVHPDGMRPLHRLLPRLADPLAPPALVVLITPSISGSWVESLAELQSNGLRVAAVLCGRGQARTVQRLHHIGCTAWAAPSVNRLASIVRSPSAVESAAVRADR